MTAGLPRRIALLGGGFSTDGDGLLDDWVLGHAPAPRPKVCFVPTASGDAPTYIEQFLSAFRSRDCVLSVLPLFRRELDDDALRAFLLAQDVVYVGGGNTAYDSEPGRRPSYRAAVARGALPAGWAVEDGVGALFEDGLLTEAVTRTPEAGLHRVEADGRSGATERAAACRLLTAGAGPAG